MKTGVRPQLWEPFSPCEGIRTGALYMKAIHGGKTKNDRLDSYKIAALLRGGNLRRRSHRT